MTQTRASIVQHRDETIASLDQAMTALDCQIADLSGVLAAMQEARAKNQNARTALHIWASNDVPLDLLEKDVPTVKSFFKGATRKEET